MPAGATTASCSTRPLHIGIAVAIEDGLLVPVIRHADRKGTTQIAKEVADLAQRARSKRLAPEDVLDGRSPSPITADSAACSAHRSSISRRAPFSAWAPCRSVPS